MTQSLLPLWYRAYVFIPVLSILYLVVPCLWTFSPYVLTHSMPYFLLGATDWGVSNVYAFTKLALWIGLTAGGSVSSQIDLPVGKSHMKGIAWYLRLNGWHLGAAVLLLAGTSFLLGIDNTDGQDMVLLGAFFLFGAFVVATLAATASRLRWKPLARGCSPLIAGVAWGLAPVSIGRP